MSILLPFRFLARSVSAYVTPDNHFTHPTPSYQFARMRKVYLPSVIPLTSPTGTQTGAKVPVVGLPPLCCSGKWVKKKHMGTDKGWWSRTQRFPFINKALGMVLPILGMGTEPRRAP